MDSKMNIAAALVAAGLAYSVGGASAQTQPATGTRTQPATGTQTQPATGTQTQPATGTDQSQASDNKSESSDKSEYSTGRTVSPETKGQLQPQGWTGPLETKSGGAPAASPQGQTPPGMQAAPEGSSKTTVEPDKK